MMQNVNGSNSRRPVRCAVSGWLLAASAVGAAQAAPAVDRVEVGPVGAPAMEIALTGPVSVEPRTLAGAPYMVRLRFAEPVLGVRDVFAEGGEVADARFVEGQDWVEVVLSGVADRSYVAVSIGAVAMPSGVLEDVSARFGVLAGDYSGDGVVNGSDVLSYFDQAGGPFAPQNGSIDAEGPVGIVGAANDGARLDNIAPVITDVDLMFAPSGAFSLPKALTVRDERITEDDLVITTTSTDPALIAPDGIEVVGQGPERMLRLRGEPGADGSCVVLVYLNDGENITLEEIPVVVKPDTAPDARFSADTHVGPAPLIVTFDARSSTDELDNIVSYEWEFDDGTTGTGARIAHGFPDANYREVRLTVTDASGLSSTEMRPITIVDGGFDLNDSVTEREAKRFLWQAAFGPNEADVQFVMQNGYEAWIDQQLALPPSYIDYALVELGDDLGLTSSEIESVMDDYWVSSPDQLRHRMAWALIQIIVMNDSMDGSPNEAGATYYNNYIREGLGNYRSLLESVTFSYQMATYLTYRHNSKADPNTGSAPDENYAREIIQLFSIGLWELNQDGTRRRDPFGDDIPTYTNELIREFARIFTGLREGDDRLVPLVASVYNHDFGEKQLLNYPGAVPEGGIVPASEMTEEAVFADVYAAIDNVFYHPNCGPFISYRLIQRLTVSNPTPQYVARVTQAFNGGGPYGTGERGDLAAVAKAILLDPEARDPAYRFSPYIGKVMEPLIVQYGLFRALNRVDRPNEMFPFQISTSGYNAERSFKQRFMRSPTVFNFYRPNFSIIDSELDRGGLVAPELAIYDDLTAFETPNLWGREVINETDSGEISPYYDQWIAQANGDDQVLVSLVIEHLMHEQISPEARYLIANTVAQINGDYDKVRAAVTLVVTNPEFVVLR
ncbi:MAG: DUF1800 family protein [Planctomycetota bacterium]